MNCKVCQNLSTRNPALSFFRFPSDYNRCREWAERCDIMEIFERHGPVKFYKSFRICSNHFESKYIVFDGRKKKLLNGAVPKMVNPKMEISTEEECPQEDIRVTQKLLESLCRFCAEENTELTDIFSRRGKTLELEEKIKVFPITVNKLDRLPLKICNSCIVKITKFHDFVRNCMRADIRLKTILGTADVTAETQGRSELKSSRKMTGSTEPQKPDILKNKLFLFLDGPYSSTKDLPNELDYHLPKDEGFTSQLDNLHNAADSRFSYISSEEDILLTKSNDVFGKRISVSSEGNITLDRYICNVCSKTFSALEILESHWKAHTLQPDEHGRFICKICDKLFPNKYRLNEHNRVHTGEYPFKCSVCSKKFHKMALLKQHSIVHESNKRFVCSVCNLRSSRKGNLLQHLKTHSQNLNEENCEFLSLPDVDCTNGNSLEIGKPLPTGTDQQRNAETEPQNDTMNYTKRLICEACQIQFLDLETLEQHIKSHAAMLEQNLSQSRDGFNGDMCLKPKRSRKTAHQRTYQCEECGVRFKRKDTLTNHVRIHTGERPFVCGSCGFAFKQKGDCLKHERNHQKTGEDGENYICKTWLS